MQPAQFTVFTIAPYFPISLRSILILFSHVGLCVVLASQIEVSRPKSCKHSFFVPFMLHVQSILSYSIW